MKEALETLHLGENPEQVDLAVPIHRVSVHTHLDIVDEPVPLDRVFHMVQLVADATGVDLLQALYRVARRLPQGLEPDSGRGNRLQVGPCDIVEFRLDRRVAGARSSERIDLDVEVPLRAKGLHQRAGCRGDPQLIGRGLSRFSLRDGGRRRGYRRGRDSRPLGQVSQRRRNDAPLAEELLIQFLGHSGVVSVGARVLSRPVFVAQITVQTAVFGSRARNSSELRLQGRFKLSDMGTGTS